MSENPLPGFFYRLFEWFCKPELFEELQGDLEEAFEENTKLCGNARARSVYRKEVLKMLRPSVFRYWRIPTFFNHTIMFRNYLKTSLRGLKKSPLSSFINIFGLAAAIGLAVFAYGFASWTHSTDQFHEHKNKVYMLTFFADREGSPQQYGLSPLPVGQMLREDFANIQKVCRVEDGQAVVKHGDNVFHERVRYVDPEFLEMFSFPLKWGSAASLSDPNSIVLSEEMAVKYFGQENPVGLELLVKFHEEQSKSFKIGGVAAEFPVSSSFDFHFLINFDNLRLAKPGYDFYDWKAFVNATFVQIESPDQLHAVGQGMEKYRRLQNESVQPDWAISSFAFEPLATLHVNTENIKDDISYSSGDNYSSIVYLGVISLFMLVLACFNYINIAIVSATRRLKEIGLRKTIGANRGAVIVQFLTENLLLTFFALLLGIVLAMLVFIPGFEQMWGFDMGFSLVEPSLWLFLSAILLVTCLVSGLYPSLYISRFQVVNILKGSVQFGRKNPLTRVFLGVQLVLACVFITIAVSFTQNTNYLAKREWGYDKNKILYAEVADAPAFEQLKGSMAALPEVVTIAGSAHHLGRTNATAVLHFPNRSYQADLLEVEASYPETMGLTLKHGRFFKPRYESDKQTVIINELLAGNLGFDEPLGQVFKMDSVQYEIVGVVEDFHNYNFFNKVNPTLFKVTAPENYRFLTLKVLDGSEQHVYEALQSQWATLFPETPFLGNHQEDVWGFYYEEISIHALVWQIIAIVAILLAGLGLYGLITLNVAGRIREFSIRKVLGAGVGSLLANITARYALLFVLALVPAAPFSYWAMKFILDSAYSYHMPFGYTGVAIGVATLVLVLIVAVGIQVKRLSTFNPVQGLKVE